MLNEEKVHELTHLERLLNEMQNISNIININNDTANINNRIIKEILEKFNGGYPKEDKKELSAPNVVGNYEEPTRYNISDEISYQLSKIYEKVNDTEVLNTNTAKLISELKTII